MLKNLRGADGRPSRRRVLRALSLLPASAVLAPATTRAQGTAPTKVAFVYVSPVGTAGWTFQHEVARQAVQAALGGRVETRFVESVPEGPDAERVMRDLAAQGHRMIVATSFGYLDPALRVAAERPDVVFEHAGGYKRAANLATYNARFYEARWLAGWLAGRTSRQALAGYVAGFPVPEVVQGINAFTLGMRAANPQARVRVAWLNTWFDPAREREAALAMVNAGADVLTYHSGSPAVPQLAEEKGVRLVSYHGDMRAFAPKAQLAAITADWSGYYTRRVQALLDGRWQSADTWGGMADGMVQLAAVDASLPAALRAELGQRRDALLAGRAAPFAGRLVDQAGVVRQADGRLDDPAIAGMDWFVDGVVGSLPAR